MWSQCMWVIRRCPLVACLPDDARCSPSARAPVPQSSTISEPESVLTSTQEVFPPNRRVDAPGVASDPRVPQKRILMPRSFRSGSWIGNTRLYAATL